MGSLTHKQDDRLGLIDQRRSSIDIDWVRRDLPGRTKAPDSGLVWKFWHQKHYGNVEKGHAPHRIGRRDGLVDLGGRGIRGSHRSRITHTSRKVETWSAACK